jgi:periplasmic copper chaperone A
VKLSIQIPPGVIAVKPQPKPGWQIEINKGPYEQPYDYYGSKLTEGVKSITWSGGNLPDDYYDEFVFNSYLDKGLKTESKLYFPAVQTCEQGVERWIEIPAPGKASDDYETPAPGLTLLPAK